MDYEDDIDYQLALRLSEELNSEQTPSSAGGSQQPKYDDEADFAYALQLQFGESIEAHQDRGEASASNSGFSRTDQQDMSSRASKEYQSKTATYHSEATNGMTFGSLAAFLEHVKSAQCPRCGYVFFSAERDVSRRLQAWKSTLKSELICTHCYASTRMCCVSDVPAKWSFVSVQGKHISWCCAGGRLLLLWMLLCGFDEHFSATKSSKAAVAKPIEDSTENLSKEPNKNPKKEVIKKANKRGRGGIGSSGPPRGIIPPIPSMPSGLGYGSDMEFINSWGAGQTLSGSRLNTEASNTDSKARAFTAQQADDRFYELYLKLLEGLLPSFERECTFDYDPPDAVSEMLHKSKVLNYCAELLRNDSLEDATKRKDLYESLIGLLRTLSAHHKTASAAIFNERPLREDKVNLLVVSFHECSDQSAETTSSLLDSLRNLNTQSELVLQGAKSNEKEFHTKDGQDLLLLCRLISDLRAHLVTNSGTSGKASVTKSKADTPALMEVSDDQILAAHTYGASAQALRSAPPGRFKRLVTEITTLSTGLPPGIFVRYAESRPDVLKVVIIGPEGTPYANGIFEFDIFCDGNFPNKPPLVQFKTTGGGRVNFNPNLYADGKVCLSLLGTWQGEPWIPNESTLLQVVISIQAMILCEEPWYNEPGREVKYGSAKDVNGPSAMYNQRIRQHTIRTAMLEWLDKTPPLWKDVVDQHFTTNADKILNTAVGWSKLKISAGDHRHGHFDDDDDMDDIVPLYMPPSNSSENNVSINPFHHRRAPSNQDDYASMLQRLQTALSKYGAPQIVPQDKAPVTDPPVARTTSRPRLPLSTPQPSQYQVPHGAVPHHTSTHSYNFPAMHAMNNMYPIDPRNPYAGPGTFTPPSFLPILSPGMPGFNPTIPPGTGRGGFGASNGFMGPGRSRSLEPQPGAGAQPAGGRGESFASTTEAVRGRYETRSSTRGRGGSNSTAPPGMSYGHFDHIFGQTYDGTHGIPSQHWREGGRGGQGGRGGRGDGGRGGRGAFGGV